MRTALASVANRRAARSRSSSVLSAIPPASDSNDYLPELAACAASIVYKSPLPSSEGHPIYIVNTAALPDTFDVDYDALLPYILARLPGEEDLIHGAEYEILLFAGGSPESATAEKKQGPGMSWYLQAYHILSRAMRKRLQKLYIVHPRTFVRVLVSIFSTVVSPKFRRKIVHVSDLSALEKHMPIADLLIPPAVYLHDRKLEEEIDTLANGFVFGTRHPLPKDIDTGYTRLPRVLRETSKFLLSGSNILTEGLFRIPPHSVLLDVLKEAYDRGQKFIVWKENDAVLVQPGIDNALLDELTVADAYGVHLATALIKAWYRDLRSPVIPESSYQYLNKNFSGQAANIAVEDLITLLDPQSATSVFTTTSREILARHLIPLLAAIAEHEQQNRMGASNLAICFSMALLRGSDEMADARMTSVVKILLEAAITQWPQLRDRLGIDARAFMSDLESPANSRLYEDPLVEQHTSTTDMSDSPWNRIQMAEEGEFTPREQTKSESTFHIPRIVQRIPLIPKQQPVKESVAPPVPKRKPAPSDAAQRMASSDAEPPRYSVVVTEQYSSVARSRSTSASPPLEGEAAPPYQMASVTALEAALRMPKRKAVVNDPLHIDLGPVPQTIEAPVAVTMTSEPLQIGAEPIAKDVARSVSNDSVIFRKPVWPASATKLPSLAKPVLPPIKPQPRPTTSSLTSPSFPKPRTPSPGLLQRMNTIEALGMSLEKTISPDDEKQRYRLEPGKLSLKKASVDDLRRLYEDRLSTAQGLARAEVLKRSYSQS